MMAEALVSCPANSRFRLVSCTTNTTLSRVENKGTDIMNTHYTVVQAGQGEEIKSMAIANITQLHLRP